MVNGNVLEMGNSMNYLGGATEEGLGQEASVAAFPLWAQERQARSQGSAHDGETSVRLHWPEAGENEA